MKIAPLEINMLPMATNLINEEWGYESAIDFQKQYLQCRDNNNGECFVCIFENSIIGLGLVSESEISFGVWGLSWLIVHPNYRRQGIGTKLVRAREQYVEQYSRAGADTIIQVAAVVPTIYEPLGYKAVWRWDNASLMLKKI